MKHLDSRGHPIREQPVWFIYQIKGPTGRSYIGCTTRPVSERWQAHKTGAKRLYKLSPLHQAIEDHGSDKFTVTILDEALSAQEAAQKEARYIRERNTLTPAGYNLRRHGLPGARMRLDPERHPRNAPLTDRP